jgi:hypothetical protein
MGQKNLFFDQFCFCLEMLLGYAENFLLSLWAKKKFEKFYSDFADLVRKTSDLHEK